MFWIVTHNTPDLDAITSVWLILRFLPNWKEADVKFVPAGKTLEGQAPESDPHILHVDTGFGILDHHQNNDYTCAAKKTYEYIAKIINRGNSRTQEEWKDEALERMCEVVTFYDHFGEAKFKDSTADYHTFEAASIIDGLRTLYPENDHKILEVGFQILDAIHTQMQEKVWAEEIIETEGIQFKSHWGKAIAFETLNDEVLKQSQKMGFVVAVRKDPKKGYIRIKGTPGTEVDFTQSYETLLKLDPEATWFLHSSKKILLNGTTKNPDMKPTKLKLDEIIEVLKK